VVAGVVVGVVAHGTHGIHDATADGGPEADEAFRVADLVGALAPHAGVGRNSCGLKGVHRWGGR